MTASDLQQTSEHVLHTRPASTATSIAYDLSDRLDSCGRAFPPARNALDLLAKHVLDDIGIALHCEGLLKKRPGIANILDLAVHSLLQWRKGVGNAGKKAERFAVPQPFDFAFAFASRCLDALSFSASSSLVSQSETATVSNTPDLLPAAGRLT